jgi:SAM-dependent methyltransferase
MRDAASGSDRLFYWLDSPRLERVGRERRQRFSGWCLWYGDRVVSDLTVEGDGTRWGVLPVTDPREEIARLVSGIAGAGRCGFSAELPVADGCRRLSFNARFTDGATEPLFDIDLAALRARHSEIDRMARVVDALPVPDPDLVHLTQGLHDPEFYRASILPAALNTVAYLEAAGLDPDRLRDVLDFGCGSGRLLVGWHALAGERRLAGCDINGELIAWAKSNLPHLLDLRVTAPLPRLPYPDRSYDLVFAVSVFTHLSLASQRRWVDEFCRILRPGGAALLTLHGASYVRHIFPAQPELLERLTRDGHVVTPVGAEGSNQFASLHTRGFVRSLFRNFELAGFFPNGRLGGRRLAYPTFMMQDVYVVRRRP